MINCAYPTHFDTAIATGEPWVTRLWGIRANASKLSHAELNEAPDLDDGNPRELGAQFGDLLRRHGARQSAQSARHFGSLLSESFSWFLWRHKTEWSPRASDCAWITGNSEVILPVGRNRSALCRQLREKVRFEEVWCF